MSRFQTTRIDRVPILGFGRPQDRILQNANGKIPHGNLNRIRLPLQLIALEYSRGLSAAEAQELDALQDVVTKASEPEDRRLLDKLRDREQRANPLSGAAP